MPQRTYNTLPDELVEFADVVADHFEQRGYIVQVEKGELGYPYTPTLACKRGKISKVLIEIDSEIRRERITAWVRYGRSCGSDVRFAICLPDSVSVSNADQKYLREQQIGFFQVTTQSVIEQIAPADLALQVQLPELRNAPKAVRQLLGEAYDQFDRSHWREGFEEACRVLENEARRYLKRWSKTRRIQIIRRSGPVTLTFPQINRMTMGQLAEVFGKIQTPNVTDNVLGRALKQINKDRIGVVHRKNSTVTEKRLRANVGRHMWVIFAALDAISK